MDRENRTKGLRKIIDRFPRAKILVVGDLMWDEYLWGECDRISPEAPVPVVRVTREEKMPGGAINVLKNLTALNVQAGIMGVVGRDPNGLAIQRELRKWNLNLVQIWETPDRPTTVKTRVIARNQQVIRLDKEELKPIKKNIQSRFIEVLSQEIHKFDAVIISDYDKGFLTEKLIRELIQAAHKHNVYIAVDPKKNSFHLYKYVHLITPNEKEASEAMSLPLPTNDSALERLGRQIKEELKIKKLLITRSHKGVTLFVEENHPIYIPTTAREVYDVTGAGDTVISVYTTAMMAGSNPLQAAMLANLAGGVVVGKFGVNTVNQQELKKEVSDNL